MEHYSLIGKPLTQEEFLERLGELTTFEDADGHKYEVRGIVSDAMELHAVGEKPVATRFINMDKLYRHYGMIVDKTEGRQRSRRVWYVSELSGILKRHQYANKTIRIDKRTDVSPV